MLSFFHLIFFVSLSKIRCLKFCGLLSESSIQFQWSSCLFLGSASFQYCSSVVKFEVRDCDSSEVLLLYRVILDILGFLLFHMMLSNTIEVCEELC